MASYHVRISHNKSNQVENYVLFHFTEPQSLRSDRRKLIYYTVFLVYKKENFNIIMGTYLTGVMF